VDALRQDELPLQGRPTDPARALLPVDPHRRRPNRHQDPQHRAGQPLPALVDNARRLRELITDLETRSLRALEQAEGWELKKS
jgi:hypothetical protein